jgi:hypothetical protein
LSKQALILIPLQGPLYAVLGNDLSIFISMGIQEGSQYIWGLNIYAIASSTHYNLVDGWSQMVYTRKKRAKKMLLAIFIGLYGYLIHSKFAIYFKKLQ